MSPFDRVRRGLRTRLGLTGEDAESYVCRACETDFPIQHHVCPECGSYSVERLDW
ncbi:hypothetical protein [Haloarchaeobius sp. TZWSO28]|uniref:hypothetical protein n=1 Tax=unclassified Haloarchaeobius TaxID=2614452 RepID=UPI003EBAB5D6